jgi:Flp pilus assembly pilin Flp
MQTFSLKKKSLGQGMTEYIIITALIAVAAIAAYSFFGQTIRHQVAGMANEMSGKSANGNITAAGETAEAADNAASQTTSLGNYDATGTSMVNSGTGGQ